MSENEMMWERAASIVASFERLQEELRLAEGELRGPLRPTRIILVGVLDELAKTLDEFEIA